MKFRFTAGGLLTAAIHLLTAMALIMGALVPYGLLVAKDVPPTASLVLILVLVLAAAAASVPLARAMVRWLRGPQGLPEIFVNHPEVNP